MRELDLIVKVTRQCNLRCTYCMDWRASPESDMPFPVLARTIQAALAEHDRVGFIWHGGDPTLRSVDFFRKTIAVEERFRRAGQRVTNLLQTNGTLLDDEWGRFFRDAGFRVGVSIDGPPAIHDRTRPNVGGRGSFQSAMRGLEVLRKYDVPHAVLVVVDEAILGIGADGLFDFLVEYGIRACDCLSAMPTATPGEASPDDVAHYAREREMTAFFIRLYDRWLEHADPGIHVRSLDIVRRSVRGQDPWSCTVSGGCFGRYFTVEPNGDINHCDSFQGDPRHSFGNIMQLSFDDMRRGGNLPAAAARNALAVEELRAHCPEFSVCNGGCPADRGAAAMYDRTYAGRCCGKRGLIAHVRSKLPLEDDMLRRHQLQQGAREGS